MMPIAFYLLGLLNSNPELQSDNHIIIQKMIKRHSLKFLSSLLKTVIVIQNKDVPGKLRQRRPDN